MPNTVLLIVLLASAAGPAPQSGQADIAEGRRIYNRSCTVCHGLDGAVGDRGPALAGTRRYLR